MAKKSKSKKREDARRKRSQSTVAFSCLEYSREMLPAASDEEITRRSAEHCDEKLLILRDFIYTRAGRRLAEPEPRHDRVAHHI